MLAMGIPGLLVISCFVTNYHQVSELNSPHRLSYSFYKSEEQAHVWILSQGLMRLKSGCWGCGCQLLEAGHSSQLPACWQNSVPGSCRTEVPISLPCVLFVFKPAVTHQVLPRLQGLWLILPPTFPAFRGSCENRGPHEYSRIISFLHQLTNGFSYICKAFLVI